MKAAQIKLVEAAHENYTQARREHWDDVARSLETWSGWGSYYHQRLTQIYQSLVTPGQRVLEIGCGQGDLLAALRPSVGVGVDFSDAMLRRAAERHPELRFINA
ncbi:MAG: methyltransferase domain-containing protein, partial [Blastocatellia bacterium]